MLHLVSLLTENFIPRARPFLQSLQAHLAGTDCFIIGLGFDPVPLKKEFPALEFFSMPRHWSESSCGIMQHGRWLDALPCVGDDDVYLLSDADIIVQRAMYPGERDLLSSLGIDQFAAGWNAHPGDNLAEEAKRIDMTASEVFPPRHANGSIPCWNTGVLAMRGIAWKRLRDLYESRCGRFYQLTSHRSRGQWLINFCLQKLGLKPTILPQSFHCHGHFSLPAGVSIQNDKATYFGETILFRHAL